MDLECPVMVHRLCHPQSTVYLQAKYRNFEKQGESKHISHGQAL